MDRQVIVARPSERVMDSITGGVKLVDAVTVTANELVALSGRLPLSVTVVTKRFVVDASADPVVQVMMPSAEIAALFGAESNEYVSVLAGMSESDAVLVTRSIVPDVMVRSV